MKITVSLGSKNTFLSPFHLYKVLKIAREFLKRERLSGAQVGIIFSDDRHLARLNSRFRGIGRTTDVLSFPFLEKDELILFRRSRNKFFLGELYISMERAREQAIEDNKPLKEMLLMLVVHGLYHLVGYDHPAGFEESVMKRLEDRLLGTVLENRGDNLCKDC